MPYLSVKSLQLIWRSGTHRWNLRVPDLQMSCRDLTTWQGTRIEPMAMDVQWYALLAWHHAPFFFHFWLGLKVTNYCFNLSYQIVQLFNSLAPGRCSCNLKLIIFKLVSKIDVLRVSYEITVMWMPGDLTDSEWTLIQIMAWCLWATSHYLSQCWPKYLSPYRVTRPQWFKFKTSASSKLYWRNTLLLVMYFSN